MLAGTGETELLPPRVAKAAGNGLPRRGGLEKRRVAKADTRRNEDPCIIPINNNTSDERLLKLDMAARAKCWKGGMDLFRGECSRKIHSSDFPISIQHCEAAGTDVTDCSASKAAQNNARESDGLVEVRPACEISSNHNP